VRFNKKIQKKKKKNIGIQEKGKEGGGWGDLGGLKKSSILVVN
jgi:hypothetical protein